jgi:hypothetical protein
MYAACSFVVGIAAHAGAITSFARVWVWVALAVWVVVFVAMIRRAIEVVGGEDTSAAPTVDQRTSSEHAG